MGCAYKHKCLCMCIHVNMNEQSRTCINCKEEKSILKFHKNGKRDRHKICAICRNEKRKTWDKSWKKKPKRVYSEYKRSANKRNLIFQISEKEFLDFEDSFCNYCGVGLDQIRLDRVDNNMGYITTNVVPCCSTCNFLKHTLGKKEFLEHIKKIYLHQKES